MTKNNTQSVLLCVKTLRYYCIKTNIELTFIELITFSGKRMDDNIINIEGNGLRWKGKSLLLF